MEPCDDGLFHGTLGTSVTTVSLRCRAMGLAGIAPAVVAAIAFGVQYVPVKKYKCLGAAPVVSL